MNRHKKFSVMQGDIIGGGSRAHLLLNINSVIEWMDWLITARAFVPDNIKQGEDVQTQRLRLLDATTIIDNLFDE